MGLILDTSVVVYAERQNETIKEVLYQFSSFGKLSVSVVTLVELAHGVARAKSDRIAVQRKRLIAALQHEFAVVPLGAATAIRAGIFDGELKGLGFNIGLADAIIAATARHVKYGVATLNVKHFKLIPGLEVVGL